MAYSENSDIKAEKTLSIIWGGLLILAGLFCLAIPLFASLSVGIVIAWIILIAGGFHMAHVFHERGEGFAFKLLLAILYLLVGIFLIIHPFTAISALTLLIGVFFLFEGCIEIGHYFAVRQSKHAIYPLINGIVTVVLAALILLGWPASAFWVIGTFVGISLIFGGLARVMLSLGTRNQTTETLVV